jgi:hypothetical protein
VLHATPPLLTQDRPFDPLSYVEEEDLRVDDLGRQRIRLKVSVLCV